MQVNASTVCTARTANGGQWTQSAWISDLVGENPQIPPKCRDRSGCANCQTRGNVRTTLAPKVENGDDGLDYNQESLENQEQGNSLFFVEIKLGFENQGQILCQKISRATFKIIELVNPRREHATLLKVPRTQR